MVNIEKMAETAMYIVTYAGTAKSCYMNGLSEAKKGNFEKARELLKEGDNNMAQAHQSHIQERSRVAAHRKVIGGHLRRLRQDLPQAGEHGAPVWHDHSSNQKRHREKCE